LQSDGSILVLVGYKSVLRYTSAGALDTTFGDNGIMALAAAVDGSLALQPNGQILIGEPSARATPGRSWGLCA